MVNAGTATSGKSSRPPTLWRNSRSSTWVLLLDSPEPLREVLGLLGECPEGLSCQGSNRPSGVIGEYLVPSRLARICLQHAETIPSLDERRVLMPRLPVRATSPRTDDHPAVDAIQRYEEL